MKARTEHMDPPPFHRSRPDVVRPVRVDPEGVTGPTRAQARGARWRRTSHGYYLPSTVDDSHPEQRIVEAAHHLGAHTAVTGWAALRWHGAPWFDGTTDGRTPRPIRLTTVRNSVSAQAGSRTTSECIPPAHRVVVDGLRVVTPVCAVAYEMRYAASLADGVRAFDMAATADLVSRQELLDHFEELYHWTGIPRAREAALWVDENTWSPAEVEPRLVWPLHLGLEPPLTNRPVFDRGGRHVGTPDLIDLEAGLAVQYEGWFHRDAKQRAQDVVLEDAYRSVGLECLVLVGADRADPDRMARRIQAARSRASFAAPDDRRWTVEPPRWWVSTYSVELRRRLTADQRARFLRYRPAA